MRKPVVIYQSCLRDMLLQATRAADVPCKLNNEKHAIKSTLDKTKKQGTLSVKTQEEPT